MLTPVGASPAPALLCRLGGRGKSATVRVEHPSSSGQCARRSPADVARRAGPQAQERRRRGVDDGADDDADDDDGRRGGMGVAGGVTRSTPAGKRGVRLNARGLEWQAASQPAGAALGSCRVPVQIEIALHPRARA